MNLRIIISIISWMRDRYPLLTVLVAISLGIYAIKVIELTPNELYRMVMYNDRRQELNKDKYLDIIKPNVINLVDDILIKDTDATAVILIDYDSKLEIIEKRRGFEKSDTLIMKKINCESYANELNKINSNYHLRINDLEKGKKLIPGIIEIIKETNHTAVAFYPIYGINKAIGIIIILYDKPKVYEVGYYQNVVSSSVQILSNLLDYESIKNKLKYDE